jgi:hypothetical protein
MRMPAPPASLIAPAAQEERMHSIVVRPHHRRDVGSLPARESRSRERHVGETPVTAVMATLSLALALGAHDVGGASARTSLLVGMLAYVGIVLLAERVHLDDRL